MHAFVKEQEELMIVNGLFNRGKKRIGFEKSKPPVRDEHKET